MTAGADIGATWCGRVAPNLVELVLFAELNALFPAVVTLEEVGRDPPELNQLVLLQALGQRDVIKVVVSVNGSAQRLEKRRADPNTANASEQIPAGQKELGYLSHSVVFFDDEEVVESLVYGLVVVVLDRPEVRLDQRQLLHLQTITGQLSLRRFDARELEDAQERTLLKKLTARVWSSLGESTMSRSFSNSGLNSR